MSTSAASQSAGARAVIAVTSQALGQVTLEADERIAFTDAMAGFPGCTGYAIVPHTRPDGRPDESIRWLQALEPPFHAFVITDPWGLVPDYAPEISDADAAALELESFQDARLFAILTVPGDPTKISINLRAPIVVNHPRRLGKQVVLLNDDYHTRHPVHRGE